MFVITHNNQNYDYGGEYPIGYKNTKEEAESFCELSRIKLREYQNTKGILVSISFLQDVEENVEYKELMDFFKDSLAMKQSEDNFYFFVQRHSSKNIDNYLRSFKINGKVPPYRNYSVYCQDLSNFYGFNSYSDFDFYEVNELGESI